MEINKQEFIENCIEFIENNSNEKYIFNLKEITKVCMLNSNKDEVLKDIMNVFDMYAKQLVLNEIDENYENCKLILDSLEFELKVISDVYEEVFKEELDLISIKQINS
jgi:hypothetical protein